MTQAPLRQTCEPQVPKLVMFTQRQVSAGMPGHGSPLLAETIMWPAWQSTQLAQLSVASHVPSPQLEGHAPQSPEQEVQVSMPLQLPSPQRGGQAPQSLGQLVQVSLPLQLPSPQVGAQAPQSAAQEVHVSVPLQLPSPQVAAHAPQSLGQVPQVSAPLQVPSPQKQSPTQTKSVHSQAEVHERRWVPHPQAAPISVEPGSQAPAPSQAPSSTQVPPVQV